MSTRCRIGIKNADNSVSSIYCHHDGYVEGVGKKLDEYWNNKDEIIELIASGDISYLDVLLSSTSLTDFISSYYIVSELTSYDTEMLKKVEEEKQKIENEKTTTPTDSPLHRGRNKRKKALQYNNVAHPPPV